MKESWRYSRCVYCSLDIGWVFIVIVTANTRHCVFNIPWLYVAMVRCCMVFCERIIIIFWSYFLADFELAFIISVPEPILSHIPIFFIYFDWCCYKQCLYSSIISLNGSGRLRMIHCFKYNPDCNGHYGILKNTHYLFFSSVYINMFKCFILNDNGTI